MYLCIYNLIPTYGIIDVYTVGLLLGVHEVLFNKMTNWNPEQPSSITSENLKQTSSMRFTSSHLFLRSCLDSSTVAPVDTRGTRV